MHICVFVNLPRMRPWWVFLTQDSNVYFECYFGKSKEKTPTLEFINRSIWSWRREGGCGPWDVARAVDFPCLSLSLCRGAVPSSWCPRKRTFVCLLQGHLKWSSSTQDGCWLAAAPSSEVCSAPSCLTGQFPPSAGPREQPPFSQPPWHLLWERQDGTQRGDSHRIRRDLPTIFYRKSCSQPFIPEHGFADRKQQTCSYLLRYYLSSFVSWFSHKSFSV